MYTSESKIISSEKSKCLDLTDGLLQLADCRDSETQQWVYDQPTQRLFLAHGPLVCFSKGISRAGDGVSVAKDDCAGNIEVNVLEAIGQKSTTTVGVLSVNNGSTSSNKSEKPTDKPLPSDYWKELVKVAEQDRVKAALASIEQDFLYQNAPNDYENSGMIFGTLCMKEWNAMYRFACANKDGELTPFTNELGPVSYHVYQGPQIRVSKTSANPCAEKLGQKLVVQRKRANDEDFIDITDKVLSLYLESEKYSASISGGMKETDPGFWDNVGLDQSCDVVRTIETTLFPGTHNSYATRDAPFHVRGSANQYEGFGVKEQLEAGYKFINFDVHEKLGDGTVSVCHGTAFTKCDPLTSLFGGYFRDQIQIIKDHIDKTKDDIITVFIENKGNVPMDRITWDIKSKGLDEVAYAHTAGTPWPTIREFTNMGKRIMFFIGQFGDEKETQDFDTPEPWLMAGPKFVQFTEYKTWSADDFKCEIIGGQREPEKHKLLAVHHLKNKKKLPFDLPFVGTVFGPTDEDADKINSRQTILEHMQKCISDPTKGRPNFLMVDWGSVGDVVGAVHEFNSNN